jgi:outer membrane protein
MLFLRRLYRIFPALTAADCRRLSGALARRCAVICAYRPPRKEVGASPADKVFWGVMISLALGLSWLPCLSLLSAQPQTVVPSSCDLMTCIQLALSRHPDLQVGEARRLAAHSKIAFEKAQWKPQLDLNGEAGYLTGRAVSPFALLSGVTEEGVRQRHVSGGYYIGSVSVNVPIVKEGKIFGVNSPSIQGAHLALTAEESLQGTRRDQIVYRVTAAFIDIVKASEVTKSQERVVQLAESRYRRASSEFKQDLISRHDLLSSEVQLVTAQRELLMFRSALDQGRRELARAMGLESPTLVDIRDTPFPPPQTLPQPPLEEAMAFAYEHRPELQAQQAHVEAKQQEVKQLQGERFPQLALVSEFRLGDASDSRSSSEWRAVAQLSGPIFDFGRSAQKVKISKAQVAEEIKKLESLRGTIAAEVQRAYSYLTDTRTLLDLTAKQIEQATEAFKLNRAKFEQQLLPESSVAEAQITLLKLEQAKVLASYDLILGYSQLELATGGWKPRAQ